MGNQFLLILTTLSLLWLPATGEDIVEFWLTKGAEEYGNGSLEEALKSFDNASAIDPENATFWFARGLALSGLKRHEEAISSYNKSLQIDENNSDVWYAQAADEEELGRMNDSLASYEQSLRINPENKFAWYNRGNLLMNLGRYDEAVSCYAWPNWAGMRRLWPSLIGRSRSIHRTGYRLLIGPRPYWT